MLPKKISFVGVGQMSSAILRKLVLIESVTYRIYDPFPSPVYKELNELKNVDSFKTGQEAIETSDMVIVGVKPHHMKDVLSGLQFENQIIVSIAAGITTATLNKWARKNVVRVMPNTPALLGLGTSVIYCNVQNPLAREWTTWMCSSVSLVVKEVENEDLMDAVTALSGSGPAYLFYLTELMVQSGIEMGLDKETSKALAIGTIQGSSKMLDLKDPATLRKQVTSPNGTTHAAIESFKADHLDVIIKKGLLAAQKRGYELGIEFAKL